MKTIDNKNIFMAAQQAAKVSEAEVAVVETKTIQQGLTSMLGFNLSQNLAENQESMTAELSEVVSGQVTFAVRDTEINGVEIKLIQHLSYGFKIFKMISLKSQFSSRAKIWMHFDKEIFT